MTEEKLEERASEPVTVEIVGADPVDGQVLVDDEPTRVALPAHSSLASSNTASHTTYVFLPLIFLTVTLLGGLRIASGTGDVVFWRPELLSLIFGAMLVVLFFRARLILIEGWFSEGFTSLKNVANGLVLTTLFAASTQVFNALLPEQGLPFWIVAFCFFWTLWNNLFAEFDTRRLLQSLGGLFGLAFVAKYIVLANLTAPESGGWLRGLIENPGREAMTWLLDLPRYSPSTGYIQFFTLVFYLLGLFLVKPDTKR